MANGTPFQFTSTPATRSSIFLRLFLCGAGGSGKTYSALAIACALVERLKCGPVHVIDSEHGSAMRYAQSPSGKGFPFVHTPMPDGDYSPATYERAFAHVMSQGARVVLVDSISHEWDGANGCLEQVDRIAEAAERSGRKPDSFSAWRTVTPMHRHFLEALLSMPAHVIVTLRAKTAYETRKDDRGRLKFEKVGLGPIQRDGIEFESDIFGWLADATLTIDKTRCDRIEPGSTWLKPGADFAALLADWIEDVAPPRDTPAKPTEAPQRKPADALAAIKAAATSAEIGALLADIPKDWQKVRAHGWGRLITFAPDVAALDTVVALLSEDITDGAILGKLTADAHARKGTLAAAAAFKPTENPATAAGLP